MSSFIKKVKHPLTNKEQVAIFLNNYYGPHIYGVGFKKDGTDAEIEETKTHEMDFFLEKEVPKEGEVKDNLIIVRRDKDGNMTERTGMIMIKRKGDELVVKISKGLTYLDDGDTLTLNF